MSLGERIKKLRKDLDLTQQAFGNKIGTTQNNIASYEIGRREPSASALNNICKTFNVNETWLRTGEGEMFAPASNTELDALANKYQLSRGAYILVEKFLDLKPEIQETFVNYAIEVASAFAAEDISAIAPTVKLEPTPLPDTKSAWEKEADEFAEIARKQYLDEKKRESRILSVKESDVG